MAKNIYRNMYKDTTKRFRTSLHLFLKWKGSVAKEVWHIFVTWLILYGLLSYAYRNILFHYPKKKQMFELICVYAERFLRLVPITFLIGFYVSQVVNRWWDQFMSLPWPDYLALALVNFCPGTVSNINFCYCFFTKQKSCFLNLGLLQKKSKEECNEICQFVLNFSI